MKRLKLGIALTVLAGLAGNALATTVSAPYAEVTSRLAAAFATQDPARISMAYRAMGDFGRPAAELVETTVNSMGYRHLEQGEIDTAIAVFELNTQTFPASPDAWVSLANAISAKGDRETALHYYRHALDLDPDNANATRQTRKLSDDVRLSYAGKSKR